MKNVYIIGADITKFGKHQDVRHRELSKMVVDGSLSDAQLQKEDIQTIHFGNCLWGYFTGQHAVRGQIAMRYSGFGNIPVTNHECACATGALAFHSAWKDIQTGLYDCTMAVGVEKLTCDDKMKQMYAFNSFEDVSEDPAEVEAKLKEEMAKITIEVPKSEGGAKTVQMDAYGLIALQHMQEYGTTQKQIAAAAAKNHHNGSLNPKAHYQFDMTVDEVLADRMVSYPLTRSMASPMTDGAAAVILCSEEFLKKQPKEVQDRAVKVLATTFLMGGETTAEGKTALDLVAEQAYEAAGVAPADIDVVEVHDASAIGEIMQIEHLMLCPEGKGGEYTESGATAINGKQPVNPSGGLISRGHPLAATGLAQVQELVLQLRGEAGGRQVNNPKIALAQNAGGHVMGAGAGQSVIILEKK